MGWACTRCGDINAGAVESCAECGTRRDAQVKPRFETQPVSPNLLWLATLFGGALAGYLVAIWNARLVKREHPVMLFVYAILGLGGAALSVLVIAVMTPPANGQPGFGIPMALALSFLLVSIPYNRDRLAVSQWIWSHPVRKLVIQLGRGGFGLTFTSFASVEGELFALPASSRPLISISVIPIVVLVVSLAIGVATIIIGSSLSA